MIDVNIPIIYINDYDFVRVDELIYGAIGDKTSREWTPATGCINFVDKNKRAYAETMSLSDFLKTEYERETANDRYLILKEIEDFIELPEVKTQLILIAQRKLYDPEFNTTVFVVSTVVNVPESLRQYISYLSIDLPKDEEIKELIDAHIKVNRDENFYEREDINELIPSLRGMTAFEIDRTLDMAMSKNGNLTASDRDLINQQKKQMVKNSGLLELVDSNVKISDIGGMTILKEYLENKAKVMKHMTRAQEYAVRVPKGVFIVGMPGCGKSLCAKAAAAEFVAPLLKLDMGSMMGKYVGESEGNLRKAIKIAEAAAPCVLWIDEVEKAFSGVGGDNSEIVTRMFGYLLGWLQDKTSSVYVIATANNAEKLPPELKRKGRFDEIFCVNLPDKSERKAIFEVHLERINKKDKISLYVDTETLAKNTEGFNGADIESVVNETVENAFLALIEKNSDEALTITNDMLIKTAKETKSISKTCKNQIISMEKIFNECDFKSAS
ncbi:MAG: AAA family ATPase [Prevotella sp.]|nr:AAA family ATPase [Prevotella sp.]